MVWLTDERRLALFLAGTIVRDPHHRESLTRQAGFEPAQNLSSGFVYIDYRNASSQKGIYLSELNITNSEKESLLVMHAFSGNDFIPSSFCKSKVHCWKIMNTSDEFEEGFKLLGNSKGCHDKLENMFANYAVLVIQVLIECTYNIWGKKVPKR